MGSMIVASLSQDPGIMLGAILGSLALISGAVVSVAAVIAVNWRIVRQTEDNNALKQSMLDMGMTADEITKVIGATPERHLPFASFYGPRGRVRCQA